MHVFRYAKSVMCEHINTSAKTGVGVEEAFTTLVKCKIYNLFIAYL